MTHLCVPIMVQSLAQARRDVALAGEAGADLVELRIDHLTDASEVTQLLANLPMPAIVTCRPTDEGGRSTLPPAARRELLDAATGATYIDLELASLDGHPVHRADPESTHPRVIISSHDFAGRPDKLYNLIDQIHTSGADVLKLVWTARSIRDNIEAFEILAHRQIPSVVLCMGEDGILSRVLAKKFGALLTFASLEPSIGTAPGQVSIADMKRLYRWDAINPQTRVFGVVACPVAHSMSPAIHNSAFDATGYDGVYLPMRVQPGYEPFKAFMETVGTYAPLDLRGLSITLPHKENALTYLKEKLAQHQPVEIEPLAEQIGAVNTITFDRDAAGNLTLAGRNTDYAAILDSITARLGITRSDLAGQRIAVLGAGGTGRTAVAGMVAYGANVTIFNRTLNRAAALAEEFDGKTGRVTAQPIDAIAPAEYDILLNTTSIGMHPKVSESPLGENPKLSSRCLVFDAVYNPPETRLLQQAQAAGAPTVSGIEMFVRQAQVQFETWTHQPAPTSIMRQTILARLAR